MKKNLISTWFEEVLVSAHRLFLGLGLGPGTIWFSVEREAMGDGVRGCFGMVVVLIEG
jgi:hypothetical protein